MKSRKLSSSGVALIIVLGFLVIISALAVAFFSSVTTELKASRNFAGEVTTRQLSDSAVQMVIGEIADATTKTNEAWASQPGMIRVYGSAGTASSTADSFYKLYSSDTMVVSGANLTGYNVKTDYNAQWDLNPAFWTDLNAPLMVYDPDPSVMATVPHFPIVDPRAYSDSSLTASTVPNSATYASAWGNNLVEGFLYDTTANVDGMVGPTGSSAAGGNNNQRLPMPVKWIYVLQDGTLTTPNSGAGATATFTYGDNRMPTQQNPIVGRIAFWTDDETCKINVNTAAGFADGVNVLPTGYTDPSQYAGSYWDSPRFYTQFDYGQPGATGLPLTGLPSGGLALCQLLQNEFQRYPGHPATTSLAPVFKNFFTSEQVYGFVPRYSNLNLSSQPSSTKGGINRIFIDNTAAGTGNTLQFDQLQPKQDRLYASLDELLFGAHGVNIGQASYMRQDNITYVKSTQGSIPNVTSQQWAGVLDKTRFFLTAQSRAPELNLYGQPRVSAWPVRYEPSTGVSGMNVFDNLILFCSTVGTAVNPATNGRPDTTGDAANLGLYRYIFTRKEVVPGTDTVLGPVGVGGALNANQWIFTGSYIPDWNQLRNSELLSSYLPQFFGPSRAIPGFGTTWNTTSRYSLADQQSILAEIFDYIRCANSQDTTTSLSSGKAIEFAPRGYIMPSTPSFYNSGGTQAKGLGRMSTLCEASVVFYYAGPVMELAATKVTNPPSSTFPAIPAPGLANNGASGSWSHWDPNSPLARYCQVNPDSTTNATKIEPKFRLMRAFVVFSTFDPMQGYAPKSDVNPFGTTNAGALTPNDAKLTIQAKWENDWSVYFGAGGNTNLGFPTTNAMPCQTTVYRAPGSYWGGRNFGGYEGFMHTLIGDGGNGSTFPHKIMWAPNVPLVPMVMVNGQPTGDYGETYDPATGANPAISYIPFTTVPTTGQEYYPFQSSAASPVIVPTGVENFGFNGGKVDVSLYYGGQLMQSYVLTFPSSSGQSWPVPAGDPGQFTWGLTLTALPTTGKKATTADVTTWNATIDTPNYGGLGYTAGNGNPVATATTNQGAQGMSRWYWLGNGAFFQPGLTARRSQQNYTVKTSLQASWSFATRLAWAEQEDGNSHNASTDVNLVPIEWTGGLMGAGDVDTGGRWNCIVQPGDTVRSLLYWDATNGQTGAPLSSSPAPLQGGDLRVGALTAQVQTTSFLPHPDYLTSNSRACVLRRGDGAMYFPLNTTPAKQLAASPDMTKEATLGNQIVLTGTNKMASGVAFGNLPWGGGTNTKAAVNGVYRLDRNPGDWDQGLGSFPDGPFANKQDEGNIIYRYLDPYTHQYVYPIPYFTATYSYQVPGDSFTSPSRQMPSPVMFGSLPSHAPETRNWETLCFCPNPAGPNHPGNIDPKDHLILDLFQMPVVEPYPISEPFSTAGKVNLNYRIVPFDYIRRSTALRAALYSVRVTAVPSGKSATAGTQSAYYSVYKTGYPAGTPITNNFRLLLDRDQTIAELDSVYDGVGGVPPGPNAGFFKTASQICEQYLIPWGVKWTTTAAMQTWWASNGDLTGDNCREKPYADLYPRLTTKSNTYTVHMRVQTLRQIPRNIKATPAAYATWNEGQDAILGEYRGSTTIERYLDPADPRIGSGAYNGSPQINPDTQSLEKLYRFRTVITKKFSQ